MTRQQTRREAFKQAKAERREEVASIQAAQLAEVRARRKVSADRKAALRKSGALKPARRDIGGAGGFAPINSVRCLQRGVNRQARKQRLEEDAQSGAAALSLEALLSKGRRRG